MIRNLVVALAVSLVVLGSGSVAEAIIYPPGDAPQVESSASVVQPGGSTTITTTGFHFCQSETDPGSALVTFTITPPGGGTPTILTAVADAEGVATVTFTVPVGGPAGTWTIVATSDGCADASSSFQVSTGGTGGGNGNGNGSGGIPVTGSDLGSTLRAGALALVLGAGLVVVAIRRRRRAAA